MFKIMKKNLATHSLFCIDQLCVFQVVFYQKHESLKRGLIVRHKCANNDYTGCAKINETLNTANKFIDFSPVVAIFQI